MEAAALCIYCSVHNDRLNYQFWSIRYIVWSIIRYCHLFFFMFRLSVNHEWKQKLYMYVYIV